MYADDFDDEKNGGEQHVQEPEQVEEPDQNLAQAENAKAAQVQLDKLMEIEKAEEQAKKLKVA